MMVPGVGGVHYRLEVLLDEAELTALLQMTAVPSSRPNRLAQLFFAKTRMKANVFFANSA